MKKYLATVLVWIGCFALQAQETKETKGLVWATSHGLEYEIKAGFNIGGTSPIPLPAEIRSIDRYQPNLSITLEGVVTKWLDEYKKWGFSTGIRLENKGMKTEATVKDYGMEIIGDGGEKMSGRWTGGVETKVQNSYVTLPILAIHQLSPRWRVKAGPYFSYLLSGEFSGSVYEGYLREVDPTGPKVEFTDGKIATYDFSSELNKFQWGAQIGADWQAFKQLKVYADFTWGFNDIFKSDFQTISFNMYPLYLNIGFSYLF
ncbi:MAG: porin family protein [Phocaeicola sp.]